MQFDSSLQFLKLFSPLSLNDRALIARSWLTHILTFELRAHHKRNMKYPLERKPFVTRVIVTISPRGRHYCSTQTSPLTVAKNYSFHISTNSEKYFFCIKNKTFRADNWRPFLEKYLELIDTPGIKQFAIFHAKIVACDYLIFSKMRW